MTELFDLVPARSVSRTFMQYSIVFCSRLEVANVLSGTFIRLIVTDKAVQFYDIGFNHSQEIRPKVIEDELQLDLETYVFLAVQNISFS